MTSELLDAFRHSAWANRRLLEACARLTEAQLAVSLPTGQGAPLVTMKHLIGAESFYVSLVRGHPLQWDWDDARQETAGELLVFVDALAEAWETLLAEPLDVDLVLKRPRADGRIMELKAGVMLAQALHHANVHREQVCAILTSQGVVPPDVSAWAYGDFSGGIVR